MARVVAIGECMVELSLTSTGWPGLGYAGDTFNTAVYLRRLGCDVSYATAIGRNDPFSVGILERMADEGIDASLTVRAEGRLPGLYAIAPGVAGERRSYYWRAEAPVRDFFRLASEPLLRSAMKGADLIYVSGITLAVVGEAGRARLMAMLCEAVDAGAVVAFDPNHRASLWSSAQVARAAATEIAGLCRYVSMSVEDAQALGGWAPPADVELLERRADHSVRVHSEEGDLEFRPARLSGEAVDVTGAGDAFNAAYLAKRLAGRPVAASVTAARALAGAVVARTGAIIPRTAMPPLECPATPTV